MWPFRKPLPPAEGEKSIAEKVDDLRDAVEHLGRRFTRLQQQVTRWSEQYDDDLPDDDDEILDEIKRRRA